MLMFKSRRAMAMAVMLTAVSPWQSTARAADDEAALELQIDQPDKTGKKAAATEQQAKPTTSMVGSRLSAEVAVGAMQHRGRDTTLSTHRVSIDFRRQWALAPGWRLGVSNRLDHQRTTNPGEERTLNSLRELYVSWQGDTADPWAVDVGRLQWRNGPAFGFNPTDFLRGGSLRTFTTVDPIALRENRLGVGMLRVQKLWSDGAISVAFAPKLDDSPSGESFSADLGSTNGSRRLMAVWSQRVSDRVSAQALWLAEKGNSPRLGMNATALFGDSVVGFAEWSGQRMKPPLDALTGASSVRRWRHQVVTGATFTLPSQWALTLEIDHNGEATDRGTLNQAVAQRPDVLGAYLSGMGYRQDSAARLAWMVYLTRKGLFINNLELTGLMRRNEDDGSWLAWLEIRHHWRQADLALQWQRTYGSIGSEYGGLPAKQALQLVGTWFF
jgi:hypothetical protein